MNKVVARYADGRTVKGTTMDFAPAKLIFHVLPTGLVGAGSAVEVRIRELKALFFVRDLVGNPQRVKTLDPLFKRAAVGRKIKIEFQDGEVLIGTSDSYRPNAPGFFIEPEDADSNTIRCYVVTDAVKEVTLL